MSNYKYKSNHKHMGGGCKSAGYKSIEDTRKYKNQKYIKPIVRLIAITKGVKDEKFGPEFGPDELSAFGALACFKNETTTQLFKQYKHIPEMLKKKKESVIKKSFGIGHGSVGDQNAFVFEIEGIPRAATLQLCLMPYLAHLQQSLRRAKAAAYVLPEEIAESKMCEKTMRVLDCAFKLYEEMVCDGIPCEDARYVLPLYTRTNIQTLGNARELTHLLAMSERYGVPSVVKDIVRNMVKKASRIAPCLFNYASKETLAWYPAAQLYARKNETMKRVIERARYPEKTVFVSFLPPAETIIEAVKKRDEAELANLKHIHNGSAIEGFLVPMSLAAFHQAIRQRTWDHSVESIYAAVKRAKFVTPPTIKRSGYQKRYEEQTRAMLTVYKKLIQHGISEDEAIGVIPHSIVIYNLIHINGWNSIHSIGKRTCTAAQWEIRSIANDIASTIKKKNKALAPVIAPQGEIYGKCPESKPCGLCKLSEQRMENLKR